MCGPSSNRSRLDENDIQIEYLDDGRVKITTGRFAGPIHTTAENVLRAIQQALGGETVRERVHQHQHLDHAGKGHSHGH